MAARRARSIRGQGAPVRPVGKAGYSGSRVAPANRQPSVCVYISVSSSRTDRLWLAYKEAFGQWALRVRRLQAADSVAGAPDMLQATEQATAAEAAYRDSRDRLMDELAGEPTRPAPDTTIPRD
jgi:hypothetical protein